MDGYLFAFVLDEMRLQKLADVASWQKTLCRLIESMLRYGMPMERLSPRPSFQEENRQARNAEEALLAVLNTCARLTCEISQIQWPSMSAFGSWISRLQGQRTAAVEVCLNCLSFLDLHLCNLSMHDFHFANLAGANLQKTHLLFAILIGANLQGANLREANLREADLQFANLQFANLYSADLKGATLYKADLIEANLQGANLEGADLEGADLEGANLEGADLRGASLYLANFTGVNFKDTNLKGTSLEGKTIVSSSEDLGSNSEEI
jgi:uncharacterized protein YjbI with pentapeptide repeats